MKEFKFKTIFSSFIKPLVPESKDMYLALSSLIEIGNFLPNIDTEANIDILPIAFNACVVNRVNKNGDVINTETAIAAYKNFINKPINVEHNRTQVIGSILTAGFSEFGTDLPLTEEQVSVMKGPFNITLGGVIWKVVNRGIADAIEESNDPTSEAYMSISTSWELGFSDYDLVLLERGEKNIEDGQIVTDVAEKEELNQYLKCFGGSGEYNGKRIYRIVNSDVLPLGIGVTETPAADVKGIFTNSLAEIEEVNVNLSSQKIELNVIEEENIIMKITSISEITDENAKQLTASIVSEFIESELRLASEKYSAEQSASADSLKLANEKIDSINTEFSAAKEELAKLRAALDEIEAARVVKDKQDKFDAVMTGLDEAYELSAEAREVIAKEVLSAIEANEVEAVTKKFAVLLKAKNVAAAAGAVVVAEIKGSDDAAGVIDSAIDNATVTAPAIPNVVSTAEVSVFDKYKKAFSLENFQVKH